MPVWRECVALVWVYSYVSVLTKFKQHKTGGRLSGVEMESVFIIPFGDAPKYFIFAKKRRRFDTIIPCDNTH